MKQELVNHHINEVIGQEGCTVISYSPVQISSHGRPLPLQVRVSAPTMGTQLPLIIFSHGFGNAMDGYAPLVDFWAAHGFVVIQATYLDSKRLGNFDELPYKDDIWRIRIHDVYAILDQLEEIETSLPGIKGRIEKDKVAAVGHSFGAHTTSMLLGARVVNYDHSLDRNFTDRRIKVGILLAAGGRGGDSLSDFARAHLPYLNVNYDTMTTPTLVVAGDNDYSPLTVRGPEWFSDAYHDSPGANALVTIYGGEHMLGGISGYGVRETTDENPEKVEAVKLLTLSYLKNYFYPNDQWWKAALALYNKERSQIAEIAVI